MTQDYMKFLNQMIENDGGVTGFSFSESGSPFYLFTKNNVFAITGEKLKVELVPSIKGDVDHSRAWIPPSP